MTTMTQQAETTNGATPHNPSTGEVQPEGGASAALALRPELAMFRMELEPRNLADLFNLAGALAKTKICGIKSPEDAIARCLAGRDLGLSTMQSIQGLYGIEDKDGGLKLGMYAATAHALCLRSSLAEEFYISEATDKRATVHVKRRGRPAEDFTFTVEEAIAADLVDRGDSAEAKKKNNWNRFRPDMLVARAIGRATKRAFPDVIRGMAMVEDLIQERDPDEFVGEVVQEPPRVSVAVRNFEGEAAALEAKIDAATTGAEMRPIREKVGEWDGPEARKERILARYNTKAAEIRKGDVKPPTPPAAPASEPKRTREAGEEG